MSFIHAESIQKCHEAYLSAIGRAIAVCQHLENCAHHVMVVFAVTDAATAGKGDNDLKSIALGLRDETLGRSVRRLASTPEFANERGRALAKGREARNWLAHEAATVVDEQHDAPNEMIERARVLRNQVMELCSADAILATASYEICEREPAPRAYTETYSERLAMWILDPVKEWLYMG
ncbi:MAG: hypothetical protein Q8O04_03130 [Deltaproteobacteria bacterium]|nr:hypothetical protein [Deltaproteobacteria bacterium]